MPEEIVPNITPATEPPVSSAPPPYPSETHQPPAAAPPEPAAAPTLAERLSTEFGFQNVKDDNDAIERLVAAFKQKNDVSAQVEAALQELRSQSGAQPPAPVSSGQQDDRWWKPPAVDYSRAAQYRTVSADGTPAWKPETPADLKQAYDAAQAYHDQWANDLVRRPNEVLPKIIRQEAEKIVQEMLGQTTSQAQEQQLKQQVFKDNDWLFEKDPVSGAPRYGQLTAEGQVLNQFYIEAEQRGADFAFAWDYAYAKYQALKAKSVASRETQAATAAEADAALKEKFLNRGNGPLPARGASLAKPGDGRNGSQNPRLKPGQKLLAQMRADGTAVHP